MTGRWTAYLALALSLPIVVAAATVAEGPIPGFTVAGAAKERSLEADFDSRLRPQDLDEWMMHLAARPHHLSSAYDKQNAEYIAALFKSWGYETTIETFTVLFPTPKTRLLQLVEPETFTATLSESVLKEDATSGQTSEQLPPYNAYSADGDVTAELVYVNQGVPRDYEELARRGIDVRGKIVIARYGGSWRGIKPKVAAEHGAIGCIIYSDPRDDGYFQGDVYPKGAYRNGSGAQRGSVMDSPIHSGDPLTPGVGATADAKRLDRKDAETIMKIPVLPISYDDALPLLRNLGGPVAPVAWRGALPITYHIGGGPARVHLKLAFNWDMVPVYDVIARLPGTDRADEWVIRGNHHDAWVNGADDPTSGQVAMLAEAKAIGELAKNGWKPRRTLIYCSWDGEEQGLLGSTEWVETHAAELREHAVVYINSDSNERGFLDAGGSHTLERFVSSVARDVMDPERKVSVLERLRATEIAAAGSAEARHDIREREGLRLDALGSGSDYTPFLQFDGVAALNIAYDGEGDGGSYHSMYDSIDHFKRFGDPGFVYGITQAQTTGRMMLRLGDADVLPFQFSSFSDTVARYADEVRKLADDVRAATEEHNRQVKDRVIELSSDPGQHLITPQAQEPVPYLNFAPLQNAVSRLQKSAREYDRAYATLALDTPSSAIRTKALDYALMHAEQSLTRKEGLPRRAWFKHQIYAPGFYTGYGVKTLPGIREAIEERQWPEATQQIEIVAQVLERYAASVDHAAAIARGKSE